MTVRVSIVVPAYNVEAYLAEAVESLLAQSYRNLEVLVVDDGSTDGTGEVLAVYENRIRVLRQDNQGQSASLNRAWGLCEGDILGYLSADDRLEPDAVEKLVETLLDDDHCVMAYPDYWLIDAAGGKLRRVRAPEFHYADVVIGGVCPVGPGALFRRGVLDRVGGWNPKLRLIPDWDFLLRVGLCGRVCRRPETLAGFRVHEGSQTFRRASEERAAEYEIAVGNFFARADVPPALRRRRHQARANTQVLVARLHLLAGRWRQAARALFLASRAWPFWPARYRNLKLLLNGALAVPRWRARLREIRNQHGFR